MRQRTLELLTRLLTIAIATCLCIGLGYWRYTLCIEALPNAGVMYCVMR